MERIKHALDLHRQNNEGMKPASERHLHRHSLRSATPTSLDNDEIKEVSYTQTRVVELNPEHLRKNRIIAFDKNNPASINFDLLRTHVLQKMDDKGWRTLAITSPTPNTGKTMLSINLAMSIAQQTNKTVMLVDFDLRRPKVGSYLGIQMDTSLNDLLDEKCELADALINPNIPRLVILPTAAPVRNSSETLSSRQIADLIKELRERYESRIIIFDLPPLLLTDDALTLLPQIDCTLLTVGNGMSTRKEIDDSLHLLADINLLGTVLNKMENASAEYYYK